MVQEEETNQDERAQPCSAGSEPMAMTQIAPTPPLAWPSRQRVVSAVLMIAALVAIGVYAPSFFRYHNIVNVLLQASLLGLLAIGMTIVMIVGGIDLSLPANMAMGAVLGALYMRATGDWALGALIMIAAGLLIGLVNGLAVARLKMIPFVVTLATMTVVSGAAGWMTNSLSISQLPDTFVDLIDARPLFGVPVTVLVVAGLAALVAVLVRSSIPRRWAYAVGRHDPRGGVAPLPVGRVVLPRHLFSSRMARPT